MLPDFIGTKVLGLPTRYSKAHTCKIALEQHELEKLANTKMPFGKFEGHFLVNIPEAYYVWYQQKGFPKGKLGQQMQLMLEIKVNGLEGLIRPLIKQG